MTPALSCVCGCCLERNEAIRVNELSQTTAAQMVGPRDLRDSCWCHLSAPEDWCYCAFCVSVRSQVNHPLAPFRRVVVPAILLAVIVVSLLGLWS